MDNKEKNAIVITGMFLVTLLIGLSWGLIAFNSITNDADRYKTQNAMLQDSIKELNTELSWYKIHWDQENDQEIDNKKTIVKDTIVDFKSK